MLLRRLLAVRCRSLPTDECCEADDEVWLCRRSSLLRAWFRRDLMLDMAAHSLLPAQMSACAPVVAVVSRAPRAARVVVVRTPADRPTKVDSRGTKRIGRLLASVSRSGPDTEQERVPPSLDPEPAPVMCYLAAISILSMPMSVGNHEASTSRGAKRK